MAILGFYLWGYSLTTEKGVVLRETRHLGDLGACPLGKCWISDLLRSFLVQSGSNRDRYSLGIYLNWTAETAQPRASWPVRDVRENRRLVGDRCAYACCQTETKETPLNPPLESDLSNNLVAVQGKRAKKVGSIGPASQKSSKAKALLAVPLATPLPGMTGLVSSALPLTLSSWIPWMMLVLYAPKMYPWQTCQGWPVPLA